MSTSLFECRWSTADAPRELLVQRGPAGVGATSSGNRHATAAPLPDALWDRLAHALRPAWMAGLGRSVGIGPHRATLRWCEPPLEIELRWEAGPPHDPFGPAAASIRSVLPVLDALRRAAEGDRAALDEAGRLLTALPAPPPRPTPIATRTKHGQLLVRYWVGSTYEPDPDGRGVTWSKLYDTGVLERRERASAEDDGVPATGQPARRLDPAKARAIARLARARPGSDVNAFGDAGFAWQVYEDDRRVAEGSAVVARDMGGPGYDAAPLLYELAALG